MEAISKVEGHGLENMLKQNIEHIDRILEKVAKWIRERADDRKELERNRAKPLKSRILTHRYAANKDKVGEEFMLAIQRKNEQLKEQSRLADLTRKEFKDSGTTVSYSEGLTKLQPGYIEKQRLTPEEEVISL